MIYFSIAYWFAFRSRKAHIYVKQKSRVQTTGDHAQSTSASNRFMYGNLRDDAFYVVRMFV